MVPPTASESSKLPPLSYADRAKQGQKRASKAPPNSQSSQRVQKDTAAQPPVTHQNGSGPSLSDPSLHSIDSPQVSLTKQVDHSSLSSPKLPSHSEPLRNTQNDVKIEQADSPGPLSHVSSQKASGPPMNVWNVRKEQMARATTQPQAIPTPTGVARPPGESDKDSSNSPSPSAETSRSESTSQKRQQLNGHSTPIEHSMPPKPSSSAIQDLDDWPAVGSSVNSNSVPHRDSGNGNSGASDVTKTENSKEAPVPVPKKGEKHKWISIPPEELQAVADAMRPQNRAQPHSRPRSQQVGGQDTVSGSKSASRSGRDSQQQSRNHSAVGLRQATSHSGSAAHSQPHSRAGSVHSSPRQTSIRGGRRLPEDRANGSINRSARSSRATSPQRQMRTHVNHPQPPVFQPPPPDGDHGQHHPHVPQEPAFYEPTPAYGYYPPLPPSSGATRTHSYQSTHATNSPASHPYQLPYPASPPTYPPGPYPGSPYPMYSPYHYPYNPYMPWAPGQEHPAHVYATGPMVPPMSHHQPPVNSTSPEVAAGIPPPTMIARPPPPGQSDAVAGYRDVGFVLPPPATYEQQEQNEESVQPDERPRQISFGSIDVGTSQSPPPNWVSHPPPSLSAVSGTLGLDVNGANPEASEDQSSRSLSIEKSFTAFTIGVAPDETGPSRSRSKTAPVTKGSLPSRERIETVPAVLMTQPSGTSDLSSIDIQSSALRPLEEQRVVDLTEAHAMKWEFGTANSSGDIATQRPIAVDVQQSRPENPLPLPNGIPSDVPPPAFVEQPYQQPIPQQPPVGYPLFVSPPVGVSMSNSPPSATSSYPPNTIAPTMASPSRSNDDFRVKNFGYGFGRGVAPGIHPPSGSHLEETGEGSPREYNPHQGGRPRRGSYGGGFGYERGGHSMRRGRGYSGGRGSGRGFSRGGGGGNFQHHQHHQNQHQKPPFTVMPPQHLPPLSEPVYYPPPVPQPLMSGTTYYHPIAYESYYPGYAAPPPPPHLVIPPSTQTAGPPLPSPITKFAYRLDDFQYRLLGQLEYYLSADNLAKDFWLRQQMDSQGWISISLIASFNRVKQLTLDVQLVRDALSKSSLVELRDHDVRVHNWKQYLVPYDTRSGPSQDEGEEDVETEDEVEIVLGQDANHSWTTERPTA